MSIRTSILKQPYKISYFDNVFNLQKKHQKLIIDGFQKNQLVWIGEHYLCYTIGKGGDKSNLLPSFDKNMFSLFEINRGGEVTCHMPGQLVVYMVLDLKNYKKDLNWYLRKIEKLIVRILDNFNIKASIKNGLTGVWCGEKKIASIGIGCKRWVTIHGFAINVNCNLNNFNNIIPCGIDGCLMTKITDLKPNVKINEVKHIVKKFIQEEFNIDFVSE
tara:strand:+ start:2133 stop:2783 length:651 start_codon:yes stop_codon:yes gene_type:complete